MQIGVQESIGSNGNCVEICVIQQDIRDGVQQCSPNCKIYPYTHLSKVCADWPVCADYQEVNMAIKCSMHVCGPDQNVLIAEPDAW